MRGFVVRLIVFLALLVVVLEFAVRIFLPQQLIRNYYVYNPDDGLGTVLAPDLDLILNTGEREVRLITDMHGFRVSPSGPSEDAFDRRILGLGDSFMVAMQVESEETTAAILEQQLSAELGLRVKIDNAASPAFAMNHYLLRSRRALEERHYDAIWVMVYAGNDYVEERSDYFPPVRPAAQRVLRLPRNLSSSEIVNALLFPVNDALESSSHLFILLKSRMSLLLAQVGLTRRSVPEAIMIDMADDPVWDISGEVMGDLQALADEYGIPLVVSIVPASYQVDPASLEWSLQAFGIPADQVEVEQPSRLLTQSFSEHGVVTVVDMLPDLQSHLKDTGGQLYGSIDPHLSPEGNELAAEILLPYLRDALR